MRILLLSREYPPETIWGGCSIVNYNLATGLASRGHEVHVICQGLNGKYDTTEDGVHVHRVGSDGRGHSINARLKYMYLSWIKFRKLKKEMDFDIIQSDHWSAEGFVCLFYRKAKFVVKTQNIGPGSLLRSGNYRSMNEKIGFYGLSILASLVSVRADCFICESKIDFDNVVSILNIPPRKVRLVYNGIDLDVFKFADSNIRNEMNISIDDKIVLVVGRLERKKGIDVIVSAIPDILRNNAKTIFLFIGRDSNSSPNGGSFKKWIESQALEGNFANKILFKDFVDPNELPKYYSASDIFLLASREESFSLVVVEAMACGKPVIATPVGIVPELSLDNPVGLKIIGVENEIELAKAVIEFASLSKKEYNQIFEENRSLVARMFSLNSWIDCMIESYRFND